MCKKLLSMLLTLMLLVTALPLGALAQEDAPANEQVIEQPVTPEEPATPEGTDEPAGEEEPTVITTPEPPVLTPEELFIAAVALLPTEPVETVTAELLTQLSEVTEQMNALVTEQQLATITAGEPVEGISEELLQAVQAVLALTTRVNELNAAAAAAVEALIVALPAADELTLQNEAQVTQAAAAYAALLVEQQALIAEENVALLDAAQAKLAELIARAKAEKIDELISQLPPAEDININNYTDYQAPAALAGNELSVLSDYEREFVSMADELADVEIAIKASAEADAVKALLDALPKTKDAALTDLTFKDGENSIAKVFEAEQAYQQLTDTAKAEIATEYNAFKDTLQVAKDLDTIRENGKIVLKPNTVNYVMTVEQDFVPVPTATWDGISEELQTAYPLKVELPADETYITEETWNVVTELNGSAVETQCIVPVAPTTDDVVVPVYSDKATALKEIGTNITFTVLPKQNSNEWGNTAYVKDDTITFNKAYQGAGNGMYVYVAFSVGKYTQYVVNDNASVTLLNAKAAQNFDVELYEGLTYVKIAPDVYDTIKNGTYKTKLQYKIPVADADPIVITTNEIKLVVKNAPEKVKFATQTINTFYYDANAHESTSRYRKVSMRSSGNWYNPGDLTFTNKDTNSPFTITQEGSRFLLEVKPGVELDKSSYKVTFSVNSKDFTAPYDVTLTIKAKSTPPKNLRLRTKTVNITNRSTFYQGITIGDFRGRYDYYIGDLPINGVKLAPTSTKYPYQDLLEIDGTPTLNDTTVYFNLKLKNGAALPDTAKTYPVLLSVTFNGTQNTVDLPLKLTYKAPTAKVKLLQSSLQLPQPGANQTTVAYAYYQVTGTADTQLQSYTVNSVEDADDDCALTIDWDYSYHEYDSDTYRLSITPNTSIHYGTSYKVVLTFDNGQKLKLTVNTKPAANKLKLGKTSFKLDLANPEDRYQTTLIPSYLLDEADTTLEVQKYDAGTKAWVEATDLLTAQWEDYKYVTFTAGDALTAGTFKFRVYAPEQGITAANAATFTVTVTDGKIKMTGKLGLSKVNVLNTRSDITTIQNIKLTNMGDVNYTSKFDGNNNSSEWMYTVGGDGAKYLKVSNYDATWAYLQWKQLGSYAMRQNGLKPIKFTLQVRDRVKGTLIAETKSYTLKLTQNVYIYGGTRSVQLYRQMPYSPTETWIDPWYYWYYEGVNYQVEYKTKSVSIKNAEKSNYRAYLVKVDDENAGYDAHVAIGYKNLAAATSAKNSETITLLLELENGVKPVEVKVKVTNVK